MLRWFLNVALQLQSPSWVAGQTNCPDTDSQMDADSLQCVGSQSLSDHQFPNGKQWRVSIGLPGFDKTHFRSQTRIVALNQTQ